MHSLVGETGVTYTLTTKLLDAQDQDVNDFPEKSNFAERKATLVFAQRAQRGIAATNRSGDRAPPTTAQQHGLL